METWIFVSCLIAFAATPIKTEDNEYLLKYFQNPEPQIKLAPRITTADRIASHGYPAETHRAVTEDGYIITMFRIPYSHKLQNADGYRPVVLMMHGLFSCSDAWMVNGPDNSLAFLLADAGFDVWLGNGRGTTYSRNHSTRSINHPYFWKFSWHEIGHFDTATMIDYALATNGQGQKAVHYVGHSQGTTGFFVLSSTRPEYNAKIKTAHMLAPVAFMNDVMDPLMTKLSRYLGHRTVYSALFENQEFLPFNELFNKLGYNACKPDSKFHNFCNSMAFVLQGETNSNTSTFPILLETHPAGCSTNQIIHYMQGRESSLFRNYDFGIVKNIPVYGQPIPPDYPVHLITAEVHLWYSDADDSVAEKDVEKLAALLPNRIMHYITEVAFGHLDFAGHMEVRKYINDPIIEIMRKFEEQF